MFSLMIMIFVYAFWLSLIGGSLILFSMRLFFVLKKKFEINKALLVLFTPCSIGFFLTNKDQNGFTKIYRALVIFFFLVTFIASIFVLYMHLGLDII